ncbi:MAG: hypothetical protein WC119_02460 [Synergistaceae bacterium]
MKIYRISGSSDADYGSASSAVNNFKTKVIAYHGSPIPLRHFDRSYSLDGAFWFSEDIDEIKRGFSGAKSINYIIKVELSINNGIELDHTIISDSFIKELIRRGYDGAKFKSDPHWIVFDDKNITILEIMKSEEDLFY